MENLTFQELKHVFETCTDELHERTKDFPWHDKRAYAMLLAQTYYFVEHTTSLLAMSAAYYGPEKKTLLLETLKHLREETNHDRLAADDVKALGFKLNDFEELPETSAFYQCQYYYIQHRGPHALAGYAMALEGLAIKLCRGAAEKVEAEFGKGVTRFLRAHAAADEDHVAEGLERFKNVSSAEAQDIIKNMKQSTYFYSAMVEHILALTQKKVKAA